jgi:hypothetical protein
MRRPVSIRTHDYGEFGQSTIDQLWETFHNHNPATTLSFDSEQKCIHVTGFPDMNDSKCVRILSPLQSDVLNLVLKEKTAQGILIIKLVPRSSEHYIDQIERVFARSEHDFQRDRDRQNKHELARNEQNFRSALDKGRTLDALRAQMQRIRHHH